MSIWGTEGVRINMKCTLSLSSLSLANREIAVSSSELVQPLWRSCTDWASRLHPNCSLCTSMSYITVLWKWHCLKSDNIFHRHALVQIGCRLVCADLHKVEHTPNRLTRLINNIHLRPMKATHHKHREEQFIKLENKSTSWTLKQTTTTLTLQ